MGNVGVTGQTNYVDPFLHVRHKGLAIIVFIHICIQTKVSFFSEDRQTAVVEQALVATVI